MTLPVPPATALATSYVHYVPWEDVDRFLQLGWRLIGSMGAHRDQYGVLMERDDDELKCR